MLSHPKTRLDSSPSRHIKTFYPKNWGFCAVFLGSTCAGDGEGEDGKVRRHRGDVWPLLWGQDLHRGFDPGTPPSKEIQGVVALSGFQDVLPYFALEVWFRGTLLNPRGSDGEEGYLSFFSESGVKELKHSHNMGPLKSFPHCCLSENVCGWGMTRAENSLWMM